MQNPRLLSELLATERNRFVRLRARSIERARILELVRAALPPKLSAAIASAGMDHGKLTIGVRGAHWASRLRFSTESLRKALSERTGVTVIAVRVKVVQTSVPVRC